MWSSRQGKAHEREGGQEGRDAEMRQGKTHEREQDWRDAETRRNKAHDKATATQCDAEIITV